MKEIELLAEKAGFTRYQKEVYTAVYRLGRGNVNEIYSMAEVPKPKVYTALEDLHREGFVALEGKEPKTYSAVEPEIAFKPVLEQKKQELEQLESAVENAETPETEERFLQILRGRENVLEFLSGELEKVEEEYITMGRLVSSHTPLQPVMEEKIDDIDIRILGAEGSSKEFIVKKYRNIGADVRIKDMPATPFRFSIYDGEKIALTLSDDQNGYITVWTNYPSFVKNMQQFFDQYWNNSE